MGGLSFVNTSKDTKGIEATCHELSDVARKTQGMRERRAGTSSPDTSAVKPWLRQQ